MDIPKEIESATVVAFHQWWDGDSELGVGQFLADALMPLVARIQAQAKAEALREAAKDAWKVWNVKPRVEDWLEARADRQENPT